MVKVIVFIYVAFMLGLVAGVIAWIVHIIRKKKKAKADKPGEAQP